MTTISNQLSSGIYGYTAPAASGASAPAATQPATTDGAASSTTYTASGAAPAPLTYTAAGLLGNSQTTHVTPQAAQAAVAAAQDAVTQAQGALMSSGSSSTQSTDIFGAPTNANDPFGLTAAPSVPASTPTTSSVQTAQNAYVSTQNIVTQSQKSLAA